MKFFSKIDLMPQINKKLSNALMTYDFIGDIPLDRDDFLHLKTYVKLMYLNLNGKKMILNKYREAFSVFLCFCAVYEFNPVGDYWSCVEKNIGAMDDEARAAVNEVFDYIVDRYNLNKNFNKSSINLLTENILSGRIIFYSGIPTAYLDNLFNILYPTVEDTAYFELSVEELLLYLKNRAADNIILQYLNNIPKDRAYNFIQIIRRRLGDNLADTDDIADSENGNFIRMQSALDEYKIQPPIDYPFEASWNSQPYIAIEPYGRGVYCHFPQVLLKKSDNPSVRWIISAGGQDKIYNADLCSQKELTFAEEAEITLDAAANYEVVLWINECKIKCWHYIGMSNGFMPFGRDNKLILSGQLKNSTRFLILPKDMEFREKRHYALAEFALPNWSNFSVYEVDIKNPLEIHIGFNTVKIYRDTKPSLIGGNKLFDQKDSDIYINLPYLDLPIIGGDNWTIYITIYLQDDKQQVHRYSFKDSKELIHLNTFIADKKYGLYQVRIHHKMSSGLICYIEYVPESKWISPTNSYPDAHRGYADTGDVVILKAADTEITALNADEVETSSYDKGEQVTYHINKADAKYFIAQYDYQTAEDRRTTTIKKALYPVMWEIHNSSNQLIGKPNTVTRLAATDIDSLKDCYLYIKFNIVNMKKLNDLALSLINSDGDVISSFSFKLTAQSAMRISLNKLFIETKSTHYEECYLQIALTDSIGQNICQFMVACIEDDIFIENYSLQSMKDTIYIMWSEYSLKIGRECILINLNHPWENLVHIPIPDGETEITIDKSELNPGIYKSTIQKLAPPSDDNITGSVNLSNLKQIRDRHFLVPNSDSKPPSPFEDFLICLLSVPFVSKDKQSKWLKICTQKWRSVQNSYFDDIDKAAYSYISLCRIFEQEKNLQLKDDLQAILDETLIYIGHLDSGLILSWLERNNISFTYQRSLFYKFGLEALLFIDNLNEQNAALLNRLDENVYGFWRLTKNMPVGYNWADIANVQQFFEFNNGEPTIFTMRNFGDTDAYKKFYEFHYMKYMNGRDRIGKGRYVSPVSQNAQNLSLVLSEFEKKYDINENRIFGKTRLQMVLEWRDSHPHQDRKDLEDRLSSIERLYPELKKRPEYVAAMPYLMARLEDKDLSYYGALIALAAHCVRHKQLPFKGDLDQLVIYAIHNLDVLYYRDAVLFEMNFNKHFIFS